MTRGGNQHLKQVEVDRDLRFLIAFDDHIGAIPFFRPGILVKRKRLIPGGSILGSVDC